MCTTLVSASPSWSDAAIVRLQKNKVAQESVNQEHEMLLLVLTYFGQNSFISVMVENHCNVCNKQEGSQFQQMS
jgi:hypothetical protein